jgi:mandelate racemase
MAISESRPAPRIAALNVRVANPPLAVPHATSGGLVASYPVVLLDLHTEGGPSGAAYVFSYTMLAAPALARLLRDLGTLVVGQACDPQALQALLRRRLRLLGAQGLATMALAAIDMAAWDVLAKEAGLPLHRLLGAPARGLPGYAPVGLAGVEGSVREARLGIEAGFGAVKAKIGYPTLAEDIAVLSALRAELGAERALMCDYNQALSVAEATRRGLALDAVPGLDLAWIEEPVLAEDYAGHAQVRAALRTPVQAGENWWGALEFRKAIEAGATDLLMPDVMKLGGVTPWLEVAALAHVHGLPLSNHLFAEVSAQLLCASPTASWFEWCNWSEPILARPVAVRDGLVWPDDRPGIGIEWDEAAVTRHLVAGA